MPGQNVTLAGFAAFRAGQNSFCHIPYIYKIIPAAHGKGQLPGKIGFCHCGEASALQVSRPDDSGREDNADIQPARRRADVQAKYVGFTVPDAFVVGYGLDYAEKYRNLPFIGVLKPEVYEK